MTSPSLVRTSIRASIAPTSLSACARDEALTILPLSDLHLPHNPAAAELLLSNLKYLQRMDYVVLLGDACGSYGTDREYRAVDSFLQRLERPYTAINGNHEFYFEVHDEDSGLYGKIWQEQNPLGKARQLRKFCAFFGFDSLWRAEHTALGSFIYLGLDDVENSKAESLRARQWQFLEEQLRRHPQLPAFVFCHAPLMLDARLDMEYYDAQRTACVEPEGSVRATIENRAAPLFWVSGHIHLRPDHYLFNAYAAAPGVWQVHCPDSWGYSRWAREHRVPQRHAGLFSRHLEIGRHEVALVTHDHIYRADIARQTIRL